MATPESLKRTIAQLLRNAYLRAILQPSGRVPLDCTAEEAQTMLEPYRDALAADVELMDAIAQQYRLLPSGEHEPPEEDEEPILLDTEDV